MGVELTPLQTFDGLVVLDEQREGWRVESEGLDIALGDRVDVPADSYEARGRATTTRPGRGINIGWEVWIFALEDGDLRAVLDKDGTFVPSA
jgi:hypothetical protein